MSVNPDPERRRLLKTAASAGMLSAAGSLSVQASAQGRVRMQLQLGWLAGISQIGEVVAKHLGYYEQEGIDFSIEPGGPNIDGVAIVASGRRAMGQVSSSPSVMLAVSQGIPIKCFAVGSQKHPYAFFSLPRTPIRKPADMVGKRIGIQATGAVLLRALLARHKIPESEVKVVIVGAEMTPLLTGQVDAVAGWLTSTTALKVLGPDRIDLPLWDAGIRLYARPYYATTSTLESQPKAIEGFLRATARGLQYTQANRDRAVDLLVKEYPNFKRDDERESLGSMLEYSLGGLAQTQGWGAMDPALWQEQIDLYAGLGQFTARKPAVDDLIWMNGLNATATARMKG